MSSIGRLDLTGAFRADVPHVEIPLGCETGESAGVEPCSCDEALALRAQLAQAAAGTIALHVVKAEGFWTIERWKDGALVESYVGVPTVAEALDRIGDWLRNS
jgi:hypothetical protein